MIWYIRITKTGVDMNDSQGRFLIAPVKAYIQMKVAKADPKSIPLESERKLGIRFGIFRSTNTKGAAA